MDLPPARGGAGARGVAGASRPRTSGSAPPVEMGGTRSCALDLPPTLQELGIHKSQLSLLLPSCRLRAALRLDLSENCQRLSGFPFFKWPMFWKEVFEYYHPPSSSSDASSLLLCPAKTPSCPFPPSLTSFPCAPQLELKLCNSQDELLTGLLAQHVGACLEPVVRVHLCQMAPSP